MLRPGSRMTCLFPALLAGTMAHAEDPGVAIELPSGGTAYWEETRHDTNAGMGLTYRFRFVMPDLAKRVPATSGPASDFEDEAERGAIDIDTETGEVSGDAPVEGSGDYVEAPETAPEAAPDVAEEGTDQPDPEAMADGASDGGEDDDNADDPTLPAAPDLLLRDPVHDDVVWLCQSWALPRVAGSGPRPSQIIISLADRKSEFGTYDPEVLQLFEAFKIPTDKDSCEWLPW